ncbi:MAG: DNA primase [Bacilli bacterium]|nr:DNA primase [Bacilli bacterium]
MEKALIDEISNKASIVTVIGSYLNLQRKGRIYVALCPFHNDTHPSLQVDPERNTFHCWVDGHYGNVFSFVMQYENVNFIEAVTKVASIINFNDDRLKNNKKIDTKYKMLFNCINDANSYYEYSLQSSEEGINALDYLNNKRHISNEIIKNFHLGYSIKDGTRIISFLKKKGYSLKTIEDIGILFSSGTKNYDRNQGRIIFPIFDENSQIVGFSARTLNKNEKLKYINSPETKIFSKKNFLYNFHSVKNIAKRCGSVYLLEGFMDVIAFEKINIANAVALMGTVITKQQIFLLKTMNVEVRIFLDGDKAGQEATWKILLLLVKNNIDVSVVNNNSDRDPDEIISNNDLSEVKKILSNLLTPFDFAIKYYNNQKTNDVSNSKREKIIDFLMPIISSIKSPLILNDYILKLQDLTKFHFQAIKKKIEDFLNKNNVLLLNNQNNSYKYKVDKTIIGVLTKIEQKILFYMFLYDKVINFYKEKIEYFYNDIYRELANFIIDRYEKTGIIDINLLISDIEMSNSKNKEELKKEIFLFNIWKKEQLKHLECPKYDILNDYIRKICELRKKIDDDKIKDNIVSKHIKNI